MAKITLVGPDGTTQTLDAEADAAKIAELKAGGWKEKPADEPRFGQQDMDRAFGRGRREAEDELTRRLGAKPEEVAARLQELETLKRSQMSDQERLKAERDEADRRAREAEADRDRIRAERAREQLVARVAEELKVPAWLREFVSGSTEDEVRASAKTIKERHDADLAAAKAGAPPGGPAGNPPNGPGTGPAKSERAAQIAQRRGWIPPKT
jgi:hypothetical protein